MVRRLFRRAAALALPVTLAICLPPLAVIALNLHAESTVLRARGGDPSRDTIAASTASRGKDSGVRDSGLREHRAVSSAKMGTGEHRARAAVRQPRPPRKL